MTGVVSVQSQSALDETALNLFALGVDYSDRENFTAALNTFKTLIIEHPEHPAGYFGAAGVYSTMMRSFRVHLFEAEYDSLLDLAIYHGNLTVRKYRKDPWSRFFLGASYGFRGLLRAHQKDWLGAFQDGLKGLPLVNQCIEMDPPVYDAYYGLGVYHYWRSAKLDMGGLFKEAKKRGFQEIGLAIRKGKFSRNLGKLSLVMIYFNEEEYEKAWNLNEELIAFYPASGFLYNRGRIAAKLQDWDTVISSFQDLLNILGQTNYPCYGYLMECNYFIAQANYQLGNLESALLFLKEANRYKEQFNPSFEVEGIYDSYKDIIQELDILSEAILEKT